ncbi:Os03g0746100 [Oryza sativa Japonica Group]|uniref:DUF1618 domain-containing protein n=3 Tax=Oryza sativa TaxID=4530 RepID=A3AMM2_ORYSJ|nr:hypothetical protein [Oryza sativa Japonica Group]ABF98841.1 hypothetical protein LOC_Os03g53440 [Oryza sativa Japonica Group]EAY91837.1 hypothetical protein OsI_13482 [Oryza sativa Indica Group]EAZ28561.1 hypothetical protein OsJ_12545 [Oryza sativa Japonica Group]BAS86352.1 Os03g0746100 [Oryza sativa Japonica Group]
MATLAVPEINFKQGDANSFDPLCTIGDREDPAGDHLARLRVARSAGRRAPPSFRSLSPPRLRTSASTATITPCRLRRLRVSAGRLLLRSAHDFGPGGVALGFDPAPSCANDGGYILCDAWLRTAFLYPPCSDDYRLLCAGNVGMIPRTAADGKHRIRLVAELQPDMRFVPLPEGCKLPRTPAMRTPQAKYRCVNVSDGELTFVQIHDDAAGAPSMIMISMWTLQF